MNYSTYMKVELEKALFIEINDELTLNIMGNPVLKKGEYPILSKDLLDIANKNIESITPAMLIDGMLYIIGCDIEFKYAKHYLDFLRSAHGIEGYIIMNINKYKDTDLKKSVILATALTNINSKREYKYNRILLLMDLYEKVKLDFLEAEIVNALESITREYPEFELPYFHLGKYYIDKNLDLAKQYLRRCLTNNDLLEEATRLLYEIEDTEKYDEAVQLVRSGQGLLGLELLIPICDNDPDNLDAKYYTALAYRQVGNNTKALMYLNELTEFAERAEVYSEIGVNLAELRDFESAIVYFKKALKITPDDGGIICNVGACQYSLKKYEEAKKTFELAVRLNPEDDIAAKWLRQIQINSKPV